MSSVLEELKNGYNSTKYFIIYSHNFKKNVDTSLLLFFSFMQPGERRIVWAYHNTSDFIEDNWKKHTKKGFKKFAFLKEPKPPTLKWCRKTSGAATIAAPLVGNLLLIITVVVFCSLFFVV